MGPGGTVRVDPLRVHQWAEQFVEDVANVVCHEDALAYGRIVSLLKVLRGHGISAADLAAGFSLKFLYLAVYTMAAAADVRNTAPEVEVIEHFGELLTRVMGDLLAPPGNSSQTP